MSLLGPFWTLFWSHFGSQVRHYAPFGSTWSPRGPHNRYLFFQGVFFWILGSGGRGQGAVPQTWPVIWGRGKTTLGPRDWGQTHTGVHFPGLSFPALLKGVLLSHLSDLRHRFLKIRSLRAELLKTARHNVQEARWRTYPVLV